MSHRYLLYIDILGFSDLVAQDDEKIEDLYEVLASLHAHDHEAFKCIIFSDTMLVYNLDFSGGLREPEYYLMFMCEFARDLLHRLTKRGIFFRSVITQGDFNHYELNSIPCFFGASLIRAYKSEKKIKAIGLFLHNSLRKYCDIFPKRRFNTEFDFVYITQALDQLEENSVGVFPFDAAYLEATDLIWWVTPELLHLVDLYANASSLALPEAVKRKYRTTIKFYEKRYPAITTFLKNNSFDITKLSPEAKWQQVLDRHPEGMSWAVKTRNEF
jgi:hypothetical protein